MKFINLLASVKINVDEISVINVKIIRGDVCVIMVPGMCSLTESLCGGIQT